MRRPTDFSERLTEFLSAYLPGQRRLAQNTVASYRDTFVLLLRYLDETQGISAERITLSDFHNERVVGFIGWLQDAQDSSAATCNVRLCALKSFCRFLQYRDPDRIYQWQQIMAIAEKKSPRPVISYLTLEGIRLLLAQPNTATRQGRRDLALLSFTYDSAARVQEVIDVTPSKLRLESPCTVELHGKGSKSRIVPLLDAQTEILRAYIEESGLGDPQKSDFPLFCNRKGEKLTRAGIGYILNKYVISARKNDTTLIPERFHCHCLRHSKSMHLLQAGVNLVYIRDILGHVSVTTTEIYSRADSKQKREALEKATEATVPEGVPRWVADAELLSWLRSFDK
jgi:site-specific recombinase XerD